MHATPDDVACLTLPAPTIGTVNSWLLKGDPVTLVDVGPRGAEALAALEAALAEHGIGVEDVAQILLTHHHVDHCGLTATLRARTAATVCAAGALAGYGASFSARNAASAHYTEQLLARHGAPAARVAETAAYWDVLSVHGQDFTCDRVLAAGEVVRAGGRDLRVLPRPGHCSTDTLFVDDRAGLAFVGDHVLATTPPGCEIEPPHNGRRQRALATYRASLRATIALGPRLGLAGHGPPVTAPVVTAQHRLELHERRMRRLAEVLADGPATAYELAQRVFGERVVAEQAVLVVWDVLGHLDVLIARGAVHEHAGSDELTHFQVA